MTYISTETGYDVYYDFAGESYLVGFILFTQAIKAGYSYTDVLFHSFAITLNSHYLSHLQDAISDYYSSRDTIAAIEEKWL